MYAEWRKNILASRQLVRSNSGPALAVVVSGSELDREYWQAHFAATRSDVFRSDGSTLLISVSEPTRKGNFLGTLRAWSQAKDAIQRELSTLPSVSLMSMVFGQGKRLSPFTQSLGNRKPALPIPLKGAISGQHLRTADLSNLHTNLWINHLRSCGFRGLVVKWGDEAVVPGTLWTPDPAKYTDVDALRFVWRTHPTTDLAREKDWVLFDRANRMQYQYSRQPLDMLNMRLACHDQATLDLGVNLGSLAVSYEFLDIALEVFRHDMSDPARWADWDPYLWMALYCENEMTWRAEAEREKASGKCGIYDLEARIPDFYAKAVSLRSAIASRVRRSLTVAVVDFGMPLWTDFGLHTSLRSGIAEVANDTERGAVSRDLFELPDNRDVHGNIIVDSSLPESADIRDSVIIDSVIQDERSVVRKGVIIGGRFRRVGMPDGGIALFSASDNLEFAGPNALCLRSVAPDIQLPEGGRHTTVFLPTGPDHMVSNESVVDYDGDNYYKPILGNGRSFADAARIVSSMAGETLDRAWLKAWQEWLV